MAISVRKRRYAARMPVEQRREQLLDAALTVLSREGYDQLTVDAIAREAGVTRPVIYSAYGGLDPLLHALLDRTQQRGLESALALLPGPEATPTFEELLVGAAGGLVDAVTSEPEVWRPILGITQSAPPEVRERINETREVIRAAVADVIARTLEGHADRDWDVELLSHLVLVSMEQIGRVALGDPEHFTRDRITGSLAGLLAVGPPISRR